MRAATGRYIAAAADDHDLACGPKLVIGRLGGLILLETADSATTKHDVAKTRIL